MLFDDRKCGLGRKFIDADLIGAPIRIVVSPRNLESKKYEVKALGDMEATLIDAKDIYEYVENKMKGWIK